MLEKMDLFFENRLKEYEEHMLSAIEGAREFYPFTAAQLPLEEGCEVLDLGCGTGLELDAYFARNPGACVTGIDLSEAMLGALAKKFPDKCSDKKLRLIHGSYFDVRLEEEAYDAAVSVESLHHFTGEQKTFLYRKLCRALKANGFFILTDYFAESNELEREYFRSFEQMKREQNISDDGFYHYDTPLTVEHEMELLREAGFSRVWILRNWGATYTIRAER